jgi:hypothetical protein
MLRIPKWRLAFPLTLRHEDRLQLFFERRGHGQAFDDHVVQGGSGVSGLRSFASSRLRQRTPDPMQIIYLLQTTEAEKISSLSEKLAQIDITPPYRIVFIQNHDRMLVRRFQQPLSSLKSMLARDCGEFRFSVAEPKNKFLSLTQSRFLLLN